jgi:tripartite-type tricarboxylate transporter receptor subunit TctC
MIFNLRKILTVAVLTLSTSVWANDIRLILPFGPGGPGDRVIRLVQRDLKEIGGVNSVIEYKPGGNGEIATNHMLQLSKTESVFMFIGTTLNFALKSHVYDSYNIEAVADIGKVGMIIVAPPNSAIKSFNDLMSLNETQSVTYSNTGRSGLSYFAGESLKQGLKKNFIGVSYPGSSKMLIDLLGGRLDFGILHVSESLPHIEQQKLVPIAVLSEQRIKELPNTPTVKEFGVKDSVFYGHYMFVGPTSNPSKDKELLQQVLTKSLNNPTTNQGYRSEGLQIAPGNKSLDAQWWPREISRTKEVIQRAKLQAE